MDQTAIVCPQSRTPLRLCRLSEAQDFIAEGKPLSTRPPSGAPPFGATEVVLAAEDRSRAYPVVDDIPILLAPEALFDPRRIRTFDLKDPKYAEAYDEMIYYDEAASRIASSLEQGERTESRGFRSLFRIFESGAQTFPSPPEVWLDATYECTAQWDAYCHLGSVRGGRVLQVGGSGIHAIKLLLGGAAEGWLLTPVLGEARCARAAAGRVRAADGLRCVVGVAEELPFRDGSFDVVYAGGCLHHMRTEVALAEIARVLRPGGRFAAVEPWRAPLYGVGTKLLGKRETQVFCRPLTDARLEPLFRVFDTAAVVHHGALTRYPLLALQKLGLDVELGKAWRIFRVDNALCDRLRPLRRWGSSVAVLGAKRST